MMRRVLLYSVLIFLLLCFLAYGAKGEFYTEKFKKIDIVQNNTMVLVGKKSYCMSVDGDLASFVQTTPPVAIAFFGKPPKFDENGTLLLRMRLLFNRKIDPPSKLHFGNYDAVVGKKYSNWYVDIEANAKECKHSKGAILKESASTMIYYPRSKIYDFLKPLVKLAQVFCLAVGFGWYWLELHIM